MQEACCTWPKCETEADRLKAINAELVAALDFMLAHAPYWIANNKNGEKEIDRVVIQTARAALSKAKES